MTNLLYCVSTKYCLRCNFVSSYEISNDKFITLTEDVTIINILNSCYYTDLCILRSLFSCVCEQKCYVLFVIPKIWITFAIIVHIISLLTYLDTSYLGFWCKVWNACFVKSFVGWTRVSVSTTVNIAVVNGFITRLI